MCEVVEISDDEDSSVRENVDVIIPKEETLNCDGPENLASTSGTNLRSLFIGMGFAPSIVNKAIEENGEENAEVLLDAICKYSDIQQPKTESFGDSLFSGGVRDLGANLNAREEFDVKMGEIDEKMASLVKMNFSLHEAGFAMDRLGKCAPIGQLMDFIFAARMAKKYEKDEKKPLFEDGESKKDFSNEALFGIMDKTLRLLEMGFSENEISAAFEICSSEASLTVLADSIVSGGVGPNPDKYLSSSFSNSSDHTFFRSLKRKMGDSLPDRSFESFIVKTEAHSLSDAPQVGASDLPKTLKGKEEYRAEPSNWKKPKEEYTDSSNSVGLMWLEARRRNFTSTRDQGATLQREVSLPGSLEEDTKPNIFTSNPCRSLTNVVSKPPYFFYGSVTILSHDSWAKISKFLYSVQPELVSTESFSALIRREGYVHNLPTEDRVHILPRGAMNFEEALPHTRKWWPSWDKRNKLSYINCDTSGISYMCDRFGRMLIECKGHPSTELERELLHQCEAKNLIWVGNMKLAPMEPEHLERIMGYPMHHTRVSGHGLVERLKSLKSSFQVDTLGYHLSTLRQLYPGGVTVLSFFSGIGGAEIALQRLGIDLKGVVSVEPCERKRRIVKQWWDKSGEKGELIQMESIHKLSGSRLDDLHKKFGGFDIVICQNPCSDGESQGHSLAGLDFSLFVEFVRVLHRLRSAMGKK